MMVDKFKVLFIYPNITGSMLIPLHIPQLSACLKEKGIETDLFDTTYYALSKDFEKWKEDLLMVKPFERKEKIKSAGRCYKDLSKKICEYNPDVICFSVVQDTIPIMFWLLEDHNVFDAISDLGIPVLVGGVGATFCWEDILEDDETGLIELVCIGEGEAALVDYCISTRDDEVHSPNNWAYRDDSEGVIIYPKNFHPLANLEELPFPDFSIFPEERISRVMYGKLFKMIQVEIDRGCPFNCIYCCAPALKRKFKGYYRQKSNDRIMEELNYLKSKYKPDYFDFSSETFTAREAGKFVKLMHKYKKEIGLPFWCQSRLEALDKIKVHALKEAGIADFQAGIEHGNEIFRRDILKRTGSNMDLFNGIRLLEEEEIKYTLNFIIGFPDDSRKLIFDSINFFKATNPMYCKTANCYLATAYKGTILYDESVEMLDLNKDDIPDQLLGGSDFKYSALSKIDILGLQRTFSLHARFDDEYYEDICAAEKFNKEGNKKFDKLRQLYIEKYY